MLPQLYSVGRNSSLALGRRKLHTGPSTAAKQKQPQEVSGLPVIESTFDQLFEQQIAAYPHRDAYESATEDLKWTTQQLHHQFQALTNGLHELRSVKERISYTVAGPIRAEVLCGLLASPRSGTLFSAIPPFRTEQMISDLNHTNARTFLFFPKVGKTAQIDEIYKVFPKIVDFNPHNLPILQDSRVPKLRHIIHTAKRLFNGMIMHRGLLAYNYPQDLFKPSDSFTAHDPASLILYGEDQFIALSQSNLINSGNSLGEAIGLDSSDATLNTLAPHTAAGQSVGFLMPLVRRSKLVVSTDVPETDIPKIFETISAHGVNTVVADEALWTQILQTAQPAQVAKFSEHIKKGLIVGGTSAVSPALVDSIRSTLKVADLHVSNGSPLTSGVAFVDGKPISNVQAKLVDSKGKDTTSSGTVAIKGVNVFKGFYTKEHQLKADAIDKNGWVVTEMKATQQANGTFTLN